MHLVDIFNFNRDMCILGMKGKIPVLGILGGG